MTFRCWLLTDAVPRCQEEEDEEAERELEVAVRRNEALVKHRLNTCATSLLPSGLSAAPRISLNLVLLRLSGMH
eukprot:COSAG02_NODE_32766_length_511_cov_0.701456_2_plen_73_part_01